MSTWKEAVFGDLVEHSAFGPRFSGAAYDSEGNIATLRTTDLDDDGRISYETMPLARLDENHFEGHLLQPGDLVITRSGTCGIAAVFEVFSVPVLPGAFLLRFRMNARVEPRFYKYYFNSPVGRSNILSVARGAVQQNLNITNVEALRVPVPSLIDQRRIVEILSAYDDLIENNRRRMAILQEAARQLYREWFVRLRFPGHEHTSVKNGVPETWSRVAVGSLLMKVDRAGKKVKKDDYLSEGPIPCIDQGTKFIGGYTADLETAIQSPLPVVVFGDHTRVLKFVNFPFACGADGTQLIAPSSRNVSSEYLYFALGEINLSNYFYARHFKFLKEQQVLIPSESIMREFTKTASSCLEQIRVLRTQNEKLRAARDLLLPSLISGNKLLEIKAAVP